ncbi:crotonase/enoyl-CoA hydratase family protein [Pseudomonas sp. BF-R-19]|uniref:crotonase/enoyl-CoA hydratase family protein n=1 Tax=Pseudomonas sp. BF-R-19 TaxID=2832397 RepID=UPI001CBA992D|nr:crotonase/enoyl-CoA hydratase family protein [Pseudomonas sp. BF-R-19]
MAKWIKTAEFVYFEVSERVARITLNRPDKRNALSPEMVSELHDALMEADDRTDVHVIVIQGAGKDFCAGYDLAGAYAGVGAEQVSYRSLNGTVDDDIWQMERTQAKTMAMFDIHKPVIAKVHGNCAAGGTDIAFMCDIVIAAEDAKIGFPATRANGTPPMNMWLYHCGPQWAKRLLFTGDRLWGRDAAKIGLVMDAVPANQLDAAVDDLARRMSHVDHELMAAQKRVINMGLELSGARTLQRFAVEMDSRAHQSNGPRRTQFKKDMKEGGLKLALKNRDEPFGDGMVKAYWFGSEDE